MKILNGRELAGFIKERQAKVVRSLHQAHGLTPKLAIIQCIDDPVIDTYVRMKKKYGADTGIDVDIHRIKQADAPKLVKSLNADPSVQGMIIQLPIERPEETETIVSLVDPAKDVDGLGPNPIFDPATPLAILWLLSGYNVDLQGKHVVLIGRGKLVGRPLKRMLEDSGVDVEIAHRQTPDLRATCLSADVIITATGRPGILKPDMVKTGAVVVDAGTASESGKTVGDIDQALLERDDLTITPTKGGVGPLTVSALFDNVIRAARREVETTSSK